MSKELPDLSQFSGTEHKYQHSLNRKLVFTDGIKFLADAVGAYWLIDVVASHLPDIQKKEPDERFLLCKLTLNGKGGCVFGAFSDDDMPPIVSQDIEYTDFPADFEFYVVSDGTHWCMMLKSEY